MFLTLFLYSFCLLKIEFGRGDDGCLNIVKKHKTKFQKLCILGQHFCFLEEWLLDSYMNINLKVEIVLSWSKLLSGFS